MIDITTTKTILAEILKECEKLGIPDTLLAAADFSVQLGDLTSQVLSKYIDPAEVPAYAESVKDTVIKTMQGNYDIVNSMAAIAQEAEDLRQNIHIKPQQAAFPTEKVEQLAAAITNPENTVERTAALMDGSVSNATAAMYNDYVQVNAEFRAQAGLVIYINRIAVPDCCKWCTALAGKYRYPDEVPHDVYRRHTYCRCSVTYTNLRTGKAQDVWTKREFDIPENDVTVYTPAQAAAKENS